MLNEYGDEIEADLARYYRIDLCDFYRGLLSSRRLAVLIRHLPHDSAVVTAINDGQPVWGSTEHLLADLWTLLLKANSDPKKTPDKLDHPVRAAMTAKAVAAAKQQLKQRFLARKNAYSQEP